MGVGAFYGKECTKEASMTLFNRIQILQKSYTYVWIDKKGNMVWFEINK